MYDLALVTPEIIVSDDVNVTKSVRRPYVYNEDSIEQAFDLLFGTQKGERWFVPDFGARLEDNVFELKDQVLLTSMISSIISDVLVWIGVIEIDWNNTHALSVGEDEHTVELKVTYRFKGSDEPKTYVRYFTND